MPFTKTFSSSSSSVAAHTKFWKLVHRNCNCGRDSAVDTALLFVRVSAGLMNLPCSYHETLKKWVEVGNSGMFRPEMLLPMGLPEDVSVVAWGLSLERYCIVSGKLTSR